jgi:hypothetical protein
MREFMKMKNQIKVVVSALAVIGLQAYGQNLVQNPGFETGDLTDWSATGNLSPAGVSTSFDGYVPNSGSYFYYFGQVTTEGYLSQTIDTVPGDSYDFSFWMAGNGTGPNYLQAAWDGATIFDTGDPIAEQPYTLYSFDETATGPTTTIQFTVRNDPSYDALDDVSVIDQGPATASAPDAASTLGLLGVAMAGLAGLRRKLA